MFNPFPKLPIKVNKYNLKSLIGQTEYTAVYKSTSILYDFYYAIKVFSLKTITSDNITILENEIKSISKMSHPHIVQFYDFFRDDDNYYLVLEFCEGGSLQQKIKDKANDSSYSEKLHVCSQIISALKFFSENMISHGDIKASNILFNSKGEVKVSDFGLSRIIRHHEYYNGFGGSLRYNSPEICKNVSFDQFKSDIWSLGVLFYRFFSCCYPFEGRSINEIKGRIISGFYPERIVGPIAKIVKKMLSVQPDQRPTVSQLSKLEVFRCGVMKESKNQTMNHNIPSSTLVVKNMLLKPRKRRDSCFGSNFPSFSEVQMNKHINAYNSQFYLT